MEPTSAEPVGRADTLAVENPGVVLAPMIAGALFLKVTQYPIIVECWRHKDHGRGKRAWQQEFTTDEQAALLRWHVDLARWHLSCGTPAQVAARPKELDLLRRAAAFFAKLGGEAKC